MQYPITLEIAKEYGYKLPVEGEGWKPYIRPWFKKYFIANRLDQLDETDFKTDMEGIKGRVLKSEIYTILNPNYIYLIKKQWSSGLHIYIPVDADEIIVNNSKPAPLKSVYYSLTLKMNRTIYWNIERNLTFSAQPLGNDVEIIGYYKPNGIMQFMNWPKNPLTLSE